MIKVAEDAVAEAVAAERERCARVVESMKQPTTWDGVIWGTGWLAGQAAAVAAIRGAAPAEARSPFSVAECKHENGGAYTGPIDACGDFTCIDCGTDLDTDAEPRPSIAAEIDEIAAIGRERVKRGRGWGRDGGR